MPIYAYRCRHCGGVTDAYASLNDAPASVECEHCRGSETYRVVGRVAYHASENTKTAKLDPKYEKMADASMRKNPLADPDRLLRKMKPFSSSKD
ncbi:MAG TPA: zinc ribbon domain-containing protein [Pseudomonadales bacterium]|jgi:putative FmdB family regulatory protein|nr:zinc ribbon domain-containing protein [Pseudomonadales bacterium]